MSEPMKIRADCNLDRVRKLCAELRVNGRAVTLAEEILTYMDSGELPRRTADRLARWVHPHRAERVQPIAMELSQELFGRLLLRTPENIGG